MSRISAIESWRMRGMWLVRDMWACDCGIDVFRTQLSFIEDSILLFSFKFVNFIKLLFNSIM